MAISGTHIEQAFEKQAANHMGESFKDVLHEVGNHFIITIGRAFSSAAAYIGIVSFLGPVDWFMAKVVIASSVAWWTWKQSQDYFIEKSPFPESHKDIKSEKRNKPDKSLDELYFKGPKGYLNQFFKVLSVIAFLAVCLAAFIPPLLPILGPAGVIAYGLGLSGSIASMPYLAVGVATIVYATQSIFYALARFTIFGYNKLLVALGKEPLYSKLDDEQHEDNREISSTGRMGQKIELVDKSTSTDSSRLNNETKSARHESDTLAPPSSTLIEEENQGREHGSSLSNKF